MSRSQRIVVVVVSVVLLVCGGSVGVGAWIWNAAALDTTGTVNFANPMAVPPLAPSRIDTSGRVFDLAAGTGRHDFGGRSAATWGFNGAYLGPTLRANRGEQVLVNVHNGLSERTAVHWHGMRLPAKMDGGPHQSIQPGQTWSPTWTVEQPAATLWYHPHPHGESANHVYRGLAGMFIVDDPGTDNAGLPHEYGVDDFPVIVQDKKFGRDGELDESQGGLGGVGLLGDEVVVNGTSGPYLDVTSERVRLRLLNASNSRVYGLGFADDREFALVASDGGLLASPYRTHRVTLSPGERAEIVVTMRGGERVVLRSASPSVGLDGLSRRFTGSADILDVLRRASSRLRARTYPQPHDRAMAGSGQPASHGRSSGRPPHQRRPDGRAGSMPPSCATRSSVAGDRADGTPHNHIMTQFGTLWTVRATTDLAGWKDTVLLRPNTSTGW
jgi:FtsP/CotA-like multicopper oxidase with cupredoxin domain